MKMVLGYRSSFTLNEWLTRKCNGAHTVHMSTTSRQTITFTEPQLAFLKGTADDLGISISDLVRRIIDQYRAEHPAKGAKK